MTNKVSRTHLLYREAARLLLAMLPATTFLLTTSLGAAEPAAQVAAGDTVDVIVGGKAKAAIFVPARLLDDAEKNPENASIWRTLNAEENRRRLRESVKDFAAILERITGAPLEIIAGPPGAGEQRLPILIGELAVERFGQPAEKFPYEQGFRLNVSPQAIGVGGESDLATSYGLYTLLDQLGCRWYIPSPLGEVLPQQKTVGWPAQDVSTGPYTIYRGIWYCDNDFARRNRLGGMQLSAGHALEGSVPKTLREEHPEVRAIIDGKPHPRKLKWTHPLVAAALADATLAAIEKDPDLKSRSLSPDDGIGWDESDDTTYDAGDLDESTGVVSKTDRLMVLARRVAESVGKTHPEVKFGVLAYVDYTRPPVREKVHPAVVPQIAPITFSRAHPMTDQGEPNNAALRYLVETWGKKAPAVSYYFYCFYLAEVSSPNPMIRKWSVDVPFAYEHGSCRYWQPETLANFETCMHALYLGMRLGWDPAQSPEAIFQELHQQFYGAAAEPMAGYWHHIDDVWVDTPEYAGCGYGHLRRWTPEQLKTARDWLDQAAAACRTDAEQARVQLAADSFDAFADFMQMRRDLAEGKFAGLDQKAEAYRERMNELGESHQAQYAFAKMPWTGDRTLNVRYFDGFYKATYLDAARIARDFDIVTRPPLRQWRYQADQEKQGEAAHWEQPDLDDAAWKTTDPVVDTWSSLGLHNYMGSVWYRTSTDLPQWKPGEKLHLWLSATDGRAKLFVNGKLVPYVDEKGESADSFSGYCKPASFDITDAVKQGEKNQITLLCTREFINELGVGGLLGPVVIYRETAK
ncbi:beta-D-glucuronidase [Lignipirellula cremea]|uniref:Beta-D-glucuronidase n=2 Tax=Lignipirellula cremea TaxID=2528010 RepID=A0A518E2M7_9BACT|nr:beta-D-glucuronidase [Lignipirellula cremea]